MGSGYRRFTYGRTGHDSDAEICPFPEGDVVSQTQTAALSRPSTTDLGLLAVAVVAISTTGPIIAACAAPALAIAAWRCLIGSAAILPFAARSLRQVSRADMRLMILAGVLLAAHFATWIPSLRFTTVASSTALVATQPVWAALIARMRGYHVPSGTWWGIAVAMVGILALGGIDLSVSSTRALIGDGLALLGAITAAAYVTVGERARQNVSTSAYTAVCYGVAGLVLTVATLAAAIPMRGFAMRDWLLILAVTITGQLLGHTLMNRVLATTSATVVSMAILFEMPGSTVIAAGWLGQIPPWQIWPAVALLGVGLVMVIRSNSRS